MLRVVHRTRRGRTLVCAVTAVALLASPAQASTTQESILQDDARLLYSGAEVRDQTLDTFAALGVDTIRALVIWNRVAPSSPAKPGDFDGGAVDSYPAGAFDPYASLLDGAAARGIDVILTPTTPAPPWASRCSGSAERRSTCNPNPAEYRAFVAGLARRFPSHRRWALFNEPNVATWLNPQFVKRGRRYVPASPDMYRTLARAGIAGLRDAGHRGDQVLIGELAPSAVNSGFTGARSMSTTVFINGLFCMTSSGRAIRAGACRTYNRFPISGFAMHPYIRGGSAGPATAPRPGEITIGATSRLTRLLDRAASLRRIPRRLPVYFTEHGFQTNPPDRLLGVSLNAQARFINESDWLAFGNSRVRSSAQYLLNDDTNVNGFQSGLRFATGKLKPAYSSYRLPIWVRGRGSSVTVFGHLRPAADGARETVLIQNKAIGGSYRTIRRHPVTNRKGYFLVKLPKRAGLWRLSWKPSLGGATLFSRESGAQSR